MPFTTLVQRHFALCAIPLARDPVVVPGQFRGIVTSLGAHANRKWLVCSSTRNHRGLQADTITLQNGTLYFRGGHAPYLMHLFQHRSFRTITRALLTHSITRPIPSIGRGEVQARTCMTSTQYLSDIEQLVRGNKAFRDEMQSTSPGFFEESAKGQRPPFMLIDCSDSRVTEQAIFDAQPGTMFTSGSIANQFHEWDLNSNSVLSYAVETLEVRHVIVMGHYGCGGVAASMLPVSLPLEHPAHIAVQTWIQPIREIYQTSIRPELVAHRNKVKTIPTTQLPELHDPAFRALVEENVRANVKRIAESYVMRDHYNSLVLSPPAPHYPEDPSFLKRTHVFIHGWVYDLENGEVTDLNVTVGPPGREIPPSPWPSTEEKEREKRERRMASGKNS